VQPKAPCVVSICQEETTTRWSFSGTEEKWHACNIAHAYAHWLLENGFRVVREYYLPEDSLEPV